MRRVHKVVAFGVMPKLSLWITDGRDRIVNHVRVCTFQVRFQAEGCSGEAPMVEAGEVARDQKAMVR